MTRVMTQGSNTHKSGRKILYEMRVIIIPFSYFHFLACKRMNGGSRLDKFSFLLVSWDLSRCLNLHLLLCAGLELESTMFIIRQ